MIREIENGTTVSVSGRYVNSWQGDRAYEGTVQMVYGTDGRFANKRTVENGVWETRFDGRQVVTRFQDVQGRTSHDGPRGSGRELGQQARRAFAIAGFMSDQPGLLTEFPAASWRDAEVVAQETLDGRGTVCVRYVLEFEARTYQCRVWVDSERYTPVRRVVVLPEESLESDERYESIDLQAEPADDAFEIPEDW